MLRLELQVSFIIIIICYILIYYTNGYIRINYTTIAGVEGVQDRCPLVCKTLSTTYLNIDISLFIG